MKFTFRPESKPLPGWTIKRAIHKGGFGEVYYAVSDAGKEAALKLLNDNHEVELRGVSQCMNLKHPNLVAIHDVLQDEDGDNWIVMEYIGGRTLAEELDRHPDGMPVEKMLQWLNGVTEGVAFLHQRGIVHRDLKPGNIFSEDGLVKVGDIGLSKMIRTSQRSAHTQSVGTVYYMAPEVSQGRYGPEVDLYALGIIVYEMLTGDIPFDGDSAGEILLKHLSQEPDLSKLPKAYRPVIRKALAKEPSARQASVREFASQIRDAAIGKTINVESKQQREPQREKAEGQRNEHRNPTPPHSHSIERDKHLSGWQALPGWARWTIFLTVFLLLFAPRTLFGIGPTAVKLGLLYLTAHILFVGARRAHRSMSGPTRPPVKKHPAKKPRPPRQVYALKAIPTPINWSTRIADIIVSNLLAIVAVAGLCGGVWLMTPGFFAQPSVGMPASDWGAAGVFAGGTLLASVSAISLVKLLEGKNLDGTLRWLMFVASGAAVGIGCGWLTEFLLVTLPEPTSGMTQLGNYVALNADGQPTMQAHVVFFGLLFAIIAWPTLAGRRRWRRFQVTSVLWCVLVGFLICLVFAFPISWGMTWAASIASVVQIAAGWEPEGIHSGREGTR